jgi:hypothetical protein
MNVTNQLHVPSALLTEEGPPILVDWETRWSQRKVWSIVEDKNSYPFRQLNSGRPAQTFTIFTDLPLLFGLL